MSRFYLPYDVSRCAGASCDERSDCLRYLTHVTETETPPPPWVRVVYSQFEKTGKPCAYKVRAAKEE